MGSCRKIHTAEVSFAHQVTGYTMDTQKLLGSLLGGLIAAFIVGVGLTEALKDIVWPSAFVGIFIGLMTGIVVFAALFVYFRDSEEEELQRPAGGME